ncbi:MAG: DUF4942 domain-containing protein [Oscillospiraceae bacterium]|nr:DUF4942 domain-containing protein [Oscillospiraceae bacterium]
MSIIDITATEYAKKGFYPTPLELVKKLLDGIDWDEIQTVLEPSAGKGNLVDYIAQVWSSGRYKRYRHYEKKIDIDCIEIDPHLRSVLKYEYGGTHEAEILNILRQFDQKTQYNCVTKSRGELTTMEEEEKRYWEAELDKRRYMDFHVVHDDFLSFSGRKSYDLIVMNPPFADGDAHLLKAIELQSIAGGKIRCILNAETLLNPYTNRRKLLKQKMENLNATVSFIDGGFSDGERKTEVSVALIKIDIPFYRGKSDIYDRLKEAANVEDVPDVDVTDLSVSDLLSRIVTQFNVEVDAGLKLIREYVAMQPYLLESLANGNSYNYPNLSLTVGYKDHLYRGELPDTNKFVRLTRHKYWEALFSNKEFIGKLTSNLREKYRGMVNSMGNYDFTLFNIQQVVIEMNAEMAQGIQDTIIALFDKLTTEHSWYPETSRNIHYYNGWKTNKAHKINSKVIVPVNGMFSDYSWSKTFEVGKAAEVISDIEKVFDYLDGNMTVSVDLYRTLERACESGLTRNIPCKYFDVTLYKKGTMHIKFHNQDLVDRFNIYCCRKKNWLPPCYGNIAYQNMSQEEKTVIDGFHGDGTSGAGEKSYSAILERTGYFLSAPTQEMPALMAAVMQ